MVRTYPLTAYQRLLDLAVALLDTPEAGLPVSLIATVMPGSRRRSSACRWGPAGSA